MHHICNTFRIMGRALKSQNQHCRLPCYNNTCRLTMLVLLQFCFQTNTKCVPLRLIAYWEESSCILSPMMLPLLEIFLELMLWNIFQCGRILFGCLQYPEIFVPLRKTLFLERAKSHVFIPSDIFSTKCHLSFYYKIGTNVNAPQFLCVCQQSWHRICWIFSCSNLHFKLFSLFLCLNVVAQP
jgi:hypothetical protein